jgi:hypothetical protein
MEPSKVVKTVKVIIHTAGDGRTAIGIVGSEHVGARRIDLRLVPARPTAHRHAHAPRGVPSVLWLALRALQDECDRLEASEAERRR